MIALRSRALGELAGQGGMMSVALGESELAERIENHPDVVIAAINGPTSVVLSGNLDTLKELHTQLQHEEVRARIIPVDYAAHSNQVEEIRGSLIEGCSGIVAAPSKVPFYSAVTGQALDTTRLDGEYWYRNLREPVRFQQTVSTLLEEGRHTFVEISPHPVLTTGIQETAERVLDSQADIRRGNGRSSAGVPPAGPPAHVFGSLRRDQGGAARFSSSLAEAWVAGVDVDWSSIYGDSSGRAVNLPTYAFQRRRYWLQAESGSGDIAALGLRDAQHPLLGAAIAPADGGLMLSGRISLTGHPWLADHAIMGAAVLPGTALLEMALHAGSLVGCPDVSELTLETPLILGEKDTVEMQLLVGEPDELGTRAVTVYSRVVGSTGDSQISAPEWTRNASATLRERGQSSHEQVDELTADQWPPVGAQRVDLGGFYERLADLGVDYGPAFQGLCGVWSEGDRIFAEVSVAEDQRSDASRFSIHPALLDAALHGCVANLRRQDGSGAQEEVRLPFALSDVSLDLAGARTLRVCVESTGQDVVSCVAADEAGAIVLRIGSLSLRAISKEQFAGARHSNDESLYRLDWVVLPLDGERTREGLATVGRQAAVIGAALARVEDEGPTQCSAYQDIAELRRAVEQGKHMPSTVVACMSGASEQTSEDVLNRVHSSAHEALELARVWLAEECFSASRLVLLTEGAIAVRPGDDVEPAYASVWGLIRSAQAEDPGRLVLLDSDTEPTSMRALAAAVACGEPQLAIREGVVYGARLVPAGSGTALKRPAGASSWRLEVGAAGTLEQLHLAASDAASAPLGPGEIRVAVRAAGVNFRDVVTALGLVPRRREGEEMIGSEGAGVVLEVAPDVTDIAVGERVMGLLFDAFGSAVVVDRGAIVPIPAGWSFVKAASVAGAFLTAYYGLVDLAKLGQGERVLVHAATGGVGMAAVQIARYLGAEVWATASPRKWDTLRDMGLEDDHIGSSRDLDFRERFLGAGESRGVDVVLNSLAREYVDASLEMLSAGGRFIEMGKTDIRDPKQVAADHDGVHYRALNLPDAGLERIQEMLVEIVELLTDGVLEPLPVRSWDVRRARDAFRFMSQAKHVGKIVLSLPAAPLHTQATALITGGAGELGVAVARHLVVAHGMRHLVLASRRGRQAASAVALEAELKELGAHVTIAACDVSDRDQLASLIDSIPEAWPLKVVIHSAAVLDDGVIESLTPERIDAVFAPKVDAAWYLHELTKDIDLQAFVMFSSVAGTLGTGGQANYAAANAFLDALAAYRQTRGLPAVSMAWGGWEQRSELTERLSEVDVMRVQRAGVGAFSAEEGVRAFDAALDAGEAAVLPVRLDLAALRAQAGNGTLPVLFSDLVRSAVRRAPVKAGGSLRGRLADVSQSERERVAVAFVREEVAAVLGHSTAEAVDAKRPFKELGFDSLLAVELRNRMNVATGLRWPATLVFDYPTPSALADHLVDELGGDRPAPSTARSIGLREQVDEPVAIVGMACRYPGGVRSPEDLWELVASGRDAVGAFPADRGWDLAALCDTNPESVGKSHASEGGFLYDAADFDAAFFGVSPREALAMDPQQRLLLEVSWEALEDAGVDPRSLRGSDTGVFAGVGTIAYGSEAAAEAENVAAFRLTGALGSVASGRISYTFGLEGPALSIDTACSSSLVAMHLACGALRTGETSLALAGGVTVMATPDPFVEFSRQRGLAADGRCKSFADAADGAGWGEGVGMLVLERLSDARRLGHRVHAIVRGSAVNQDGASNGLTAPNGPAQQRVIRQALANAGLSSEEVDAVEAHGTGTVLGDPIEAQALLAAYGQGRERPLWLGSIKSNIGHTQLAAGAAGAIKMVMALRNSLLPRTLHVQEPSREVDWASGSVALLTEEQAWAKEGEPRRAGVSSFGVSGTNAHLILEEAPSAPEEANLPEQAGLPDDGLVSWALSAQGPQALRDQAARLYDFVCADPALGLRDVATSLARRAALEDRAVVLGEDREQLLGGLGAISSGAYAAQVRQGKVKAAGGTVAFLFTGQGAQHAGMGRRLYERLPAMREALEEVCAQLDPHLGRSLLDVLFAEPGSPEAGLLDQTMFTQAGMFAIEVAVCGVFDSWGMRPDYVTGHSIGELTAAYVAGVFSLQDACKLVAARGRLMDELPGGGAMFAVQASESEVLESLAGYEQTIALAAVNGPSAVVLSGDEQDASVIAELWRTRGRKVKRLRVSHAFHSPRMEVMLPSFAEVAGEVSFSRPQIPVVSNITGEAALEELCTPEYWVRHVRETVRFSDGLRWLADQGVGSFLEVGPDGVLAAIAEECFCESEPRQAVDPPTVLATMKAGHAEVDSLLTALAELWNNGADADWEATLHGSRAKWAKLPTYPFQRHRYWLENRQADTGVDLGGSPLERWSYEVRWKPIVVAPSPDASGVWLVVAPATLGEQGWMAGLIEGLERRGLVVVSVRCHPGEYSRERLAERLREAIEGLAGAPAIAGLVSLLAFGDDGEDGRRLAPDGLIGALALAQAQEDAAVSAPLWLVSRAAMSVSPLDAIGDPSQAQVWGLGMTLGLEHAERWGGLVNLPEAPQGRSGSALAGALVGAGDEDQLAIRDTDVFARRLHRAAGRRTGRGGWSPPEGTVLVTGGTGALGGHVARWLARGEARHLLLVGRRGAQAPGADALQAELSALGAEVTLAACDVTDRERLSELIGSVPERWPLRAVVHAAGVGRRCVIDSLTVNALEQDLAAKVEGARHLDELTKELELSAFVLFSSIAATMGSGSQAGYAAANAHLDALALARRAKGLPATSIAWGPWEGGGMAAHEQAHEALSRHGLECMDADRAIDALEQALLRGEASVSVADIRWDIYAPLFASARPRPLIEDLSEVQAALAPGGEQESSARLLARMQGLQERERRQILLETVRTEVARVLGYDSPASVNPERAFKDLGFDSLMAVELRNKLGVATGVRLVATVVFDYPTPAKVVEHLLEEIEQGEGSTGVGVDAGLTAFEAVLAGIEEPEQRMSAVARAQAFLAGLDADNDQVSRHEEGERVAVGERVRSASDEEMFEFIDRELGSL